MTLVDTAMASALREAGLAEKVDLRSVINEGSRALLKHFNAQEMILEKEGERALFTTSYQPHRAQLWAPEARAAVRAALIEGNYTVEDNRPRQVVVRV